MCQHWNVIITRAAIEDLKTFTKQDRAVLFEALEKLSNVYDPTRAFHVCELRFSDPEKPWYRLRVIEGKLKARVLFTVRRERRDIVVTAVLVRDNATYEIGEVRYLEAAR